MVGVPRSKGCQTCLSRRTKCDEARPACGNCIKHGTVCPGYERGFKFVAGKHTVKPRGRRQPQSQTPRSSAVHATPPHPDSGPASFHAWQVVGHVYVDDRGQGVASGPLPVTALEKIQSALLRNYTVPQALHSSTTQFVATLLETFKYSSPQDEFLMSGTWLIDVAGRLSRSRALETSACAFTRHLLGKANRDEQVIAQSRTIYGQSLRYLQQSLNHPVHWKSPETLGASLILCLYEVRIIFHSVISYCSCRM
jgi:hypothetical protein